MSATVNWFDEEKTIIVHYFDGKWTLQDYLQSLKDSELMLNTVDHPVTLFLDMTHSKGLPKGFMSVLRANAKRRHPNSGQVLMIGANPIILAFIKLFSKIYYNPNSRFFIVGSIDEALGVIGYTIVPAK